MITPGLGAPPEQPPVPDGMNSESEKADPAVIGTAQLGIVPEIEG